MRSIQRRTGPGWTFPLNSFQPEPAATLLPTPAKAIADFANKPVVAFETSWEATPGKLTADQVRTGARGSVMGGGFYLYAECFEPTLTWEDGSARSLVLTITTRSYICRWKTDRRTDDLKVGSG